MKHLTTIYYNGKNEKVAIETSVYQDKKMYEVNYHGQFVIVYKEEGGWHAEDEKFDIEWVNAVGHAIDNLKEIKVDNLPITVSNANS